MKSLKKYELIRNQLISDDTLISLLSTQPNNTICVFTVEKPEHIQTDCYVVLRFKELSGGYVFSDSLEVTIVGKDLIKLLNIKDKIIELLDDPRNSKIIADSSNNAILTTKLVNGGGIAKNSDTNNFNVIHYFEIKTF